jgi:hypothetical protein
MNTLPRFFAASALALVGVLAPLTASAKTCTTDAECNPNQKCEEIGSLTVGACPPCAPGSECPPCDPAPEQGETTHECVDQPIACTTDADCPSYLACTVNSVDVDCPPCASDGGECPPCEAPPTSGQKVCSYVHRSCENDAQCGNGFTCQASASETCVGSAPACAPDEECPAPADPVCTKDESSYCQVKIIDCSSNADCPTDFSCEEVSEGGCGSATGGGVSTPPSSGSGGGTDPAPPAPNPTPSPSPQGNDDPGCTTVTRNVCIPKGVGFGSASDGDLGASFGGSNESGTASPQAPGDSKNGSGSSAEPTAGAGTSDDDGCSVSGPLGTTGSSPWAALSLAVAALVGLGRRRRA